MNGLLGQYLANILKSGNWGHKKNPNIEKTAFKVVQIKSLAMHITNQKRYFNLFTVKYLYGTYLIS